MSKTEKLKNKSVPGKTWLFDSPILVALVENHQKFYIDGEWLERKRAFERIEAEKRRLGDLNANLGRAILFKPFAQKVGKYQQIKTT